MNFISSKIIDKIQKKKIVELYIDKDRKLIALKIR